MSKPAKRCVYCGSTGVTKEHLWGKWTARHLPRRSTGSSQWVSRVIDLSDHHLLQHGEGRMTRPGDPRSQQLRIVCAKCNNGWMRSNNEAAAPLLVRLGNGNWTDLTVEERGNLATWATMFAMSHEFGDPETVAVSPEERSALRKFQIPPDGWSIWIASYEGERWYDAVHHSSYGIYSKTEPIGRANSQLTTFTFGKLLLVVHSSRASKPFDFEILADAADLQRLWPLTDQAIRAPAALDDETVDEFAWGFDAFILGMLMNTSHVDQ